MEVSEDFNRNQDQCVLHLYHVLQYLEQFKSENSESGIIHVSENWVRFHYSREMRCGMCNEKGVAVGYCRDCEKPCFIDHLCLKFHKKISTLEGHRLIDFKSDGRNFRIRDFAPQQFCENHKDLELELYCNNCKNQFCQKCEGTKHEYEHNVHSTNIIYMLLDNIHDTKHQIQGLQTNQNLDQHTRDKLATMIKWIDCALGIDNKYSSIKDVPVPLEIFKLLTHESSANVVFIKCEAVIEKLANIQGDLCFAFPDQSRQAQREEDDTIPKVVNNADDQSLVNSTYSTIYQRRSHAGINSQIGGFTNAAGTDHYIRIRQVVEDEVTGTQQEMDPNVNVNSYREVHSRGTHNGDNRPNRPLDNDDDLLVEQARWLPKNTFMIQRRKDPRDKIREMGFSIKDIEKAYAVFESGPEVKEITVDMLLFELLDGKNSCMVSRNTTNETKENPRCFASQQGRREEQKCTKHEVEIICQICTENIVTTALRPCGHLAACMKCAPGLEKCPICRTVIKIN